MRSVTLFSAIALCGVPALASAQSAMTAPPDYSADYQVSADGESYAMDMMSSGSKMRIQVDMAEANSVNIIDRDTMQSVTLVDVSGMKMAMKVDAASVLPGTLSELTESEAGSMPPSTGTKTVAGHACNIHSTEGSQVCLTSDGIMLEVVSPDGGMVATRLERRTQDPSLFEVPPGYQVMDMGGMMGGLKLPGFSD
ncbi:MAG: hypothetical protein WBF53_12530 [Litorimonas sp.]